MKRSEIWALRLRTGEAVALLVLARLLVRFAQFSSWRSRLGWPGSANAGQEAFARRLARHVERAATRLPGASRCLSQAMALSWMLRAQRVPHSVALMVRPKESRGGTDDLHAMVRCGAAIVLGNLPGPWIETLALPLSD